MSKRIAVLFCMLSVLLLTSCRVDPVEMPSGGADAGEAAATTASQVESQAQSGDPTTPADTVRTEKYTIYWEDGKCYMRFRSVNGSDSGSAEEMERIYYPEFSSVKEMKEALSKGDLSDREIEALMLYSSSKSNIVEICDVSKFYEACLPENTSISYVIFGGTWYQFELSNGNIACVVKEDYLRELERYHTGGGLSDNNEIISVENVADRNAEVTKYVYMDKTVTIVRYENELAKGSQNVMELYNDKDGLVLINLAGECDGAYYVASILDISERPSLEWLASFGLREYVETEVS